MDVIPSDQPQAFYQCLLAGIAVLPGQSSAAYKLHLRGDRVDAPAALEGGSSSSDGPIQDDGFAVGGGLEPPPLPPPKDPPRPKKRKHDDSDDDLAVWLVPVQETEGPGRNERGRGSADPWFPPTEAPPLEGPPVAPPPPPPLPPQDEDTCGSTTSFVFCFRSYFDYLCLVLLFVF